MLAGQQFKAVPYETNLDTLEETRISLKWFQNAYRDPNNPWTVLPNSNHQHTIGGSQSSVVDQRGETLVDGGMNFSWIWIGRIESVERNETNRANFKAEVFVHELAHQWHVNHDEPTYAGLKGHCDKNMYNNASLLCTMHFPTADSEPQYKDRVVEFHYIAKPDGTVDSEYVTIRQRVEPVPQAYP